MGGEDIDAFEATCAWVSPRAGMRSFRSARTSMKTELPGELCYCDDAGAVCRCWNWRDGVRTALAADSKNAFLIIECVEPERVEDCRAQSMSLRSLWSATSVPPSRPRSLSHPSTARPSSPSEGLRAGDPNMGDCLQCRTAR